LNICFGSGPVEQYQAEPTPVCNRPVATRPMTTVSFPTACTTLSPHHPCAHGFRSTTAHGLAHVRRHRLALSSARAIVEAKSPFAFPSSRTTSASSSSSRLCFASRRVPLLQALPLGAADASSCASVSPSTGGHLEPSRPPLRADRTPRDAVRFLDRVDLTAGSRLRPRSEAISSSPSSRDSPSSSSTHPLMVSGR
jgi:hypothetical protein